MALTASSISKDGLSVRTDYASAIGRSLGVDLAKIGFNLNFAPVLDVNSNPDNPVINLRSFSDDPSIVGTMGRMVIQGLHQEGIMSGAKHFPGHGDTNVDSHTGLPIVRRSSVKEARDIDLAPFKAAIQSANTEQVPDMVMSAHIQYPTLDSTKIKSRQGELIYTPATFSHYLQTEVLRNEFNFKGVTITDALDMGAITHFFGKENAMSLTFKAGVDIALMPFMVHSPEEIKQASRVMSHVVNNPDNVLFWKNKASLVRILSLKEKYHLIGRDVRGAEKEYGDSNQRDFSFTPLYSASKLEMNVDKKSVTLVKNKQYGSRFSLPLPKKKLKILALFPLPSQAAGFIEQVDSLAKDGKVIKPTISSLSLLHSTLEETYKEIKKNDVVIVGSMEPVPSTVSHMTPEDLEVIEAMKKDGVHQYMINLAKKSLYFAENKGIKTIFMSLGAPYDLGQDGYRKASDAMLALYNFYGYNEDLGWMGPQMRVATNIVFGVYDPKGRLPLNVYDSNEGRVATTLLYPRGYGCYFHRFCDVH